jgi:predicted RNA binding protein YcfA (HicA-like mRNA interferase family)
VKRADLVRHLEGHGCRLLREGARHSLFVNPATDRKSTVPRHREINDYLCRKICRDLEIPEIGGSLHEPAANYDIALTASGISTAPATPCSPIPRLA